jgi:hypothetical protein
VRDALGIELGDVVVASSTSFAEITPSTYAADLVLSGDLATAVIEVQLARDAKKRRSWPLYLASAHAMHDKPTWLVVIALDPRVAAWARQPIETFHGGALTPLVIGPEQVPRVVDAEVASNVPELAVLSALAHGHEPGAEDIALAAFIAATVVGQGDEDRGKLYADAVMHALSNAAREALEAKMKAQGYEYQSEWARTYVAQGRAEGLAEGLERGREEGLRTAVRFACEVLGIEWTDAHEQAITALDAPQLDALYATIKRERRWPD